MDKSDEINYYLGFSVFPGIGPIRFQNLIKHFGNAKAAYSSSQNDLINCGLGAKLVYDFITFRNSFNINNYIKNIIASKITVITDSDKLYPKNLLEISDHPFLLYIKGHKLDLLNESSKRIAVVGTRKITRYGIDCTNIITKGLVKNGYVIVSGLAYGVDSIAHLSAIEANGLTIGVLGCGVDVVAPPSSNKIYNDIVDSFGIIISEMPLGLSPNKGIFPARNRIISGLSNGVVVVEGTMKSGSLITARYALDQGREVFAVPGQITSIYSSGPLSLIKNGAIPISTSADIIESLEGIKIEDKKTNEVDLSNVTGANDIHKLIVDVLKNENCQLEDIIKITKLPASSIVSAITLLEINGIVRDYGNKIYGLQFD